MAVPAFLLPYMYTCTYYCIDGYHIQVRVVQMYDWFKLPSGSSASDFRDDLFFSRHHLFLAHVCHFTSIETQPSFRVGNSRCATQTFACAGASVAHYFLHIAVAWSELFAIDVKHALFSSPARTNTNFEKAEFL